MNTFHIHYHEQDLIVTEQSNDHFKVELPNKEMCLRLKQDNDGANHWIEDGKDNETVETMEVGLAIERYLNNKDN